MVMKFGNYLKQFAVPKWRLYYLDYAYLKKSLKGLFLLFFFCFLFLFLLFLPPFLFLTSFFFFFFSSRLKEVFPSRGNFGTLLHCCCRWFPFFFFFFPSLLYTLPSPLFTHSFCSLAEVKKVNDFFMVTSQQLSAKLDSFSKLVTHEVFFSFSFLFFPFCLPPLSFLYLSFLFQTPHPHPKPKQHQQNFFVSSPDTLKQEIEGFVRDLIDLDHYTKVNFEGFRKIMKKVSFFFFFFFFSFFLSLSFSLFFSLFFLSLSFSLFWP